MTVRLTETTPLSEAGIGTAKSGRMKVRAISAGVGSSGYYSPKVLEQAAADGLISEGTHLYLDHPTDIEDAERPGRSVRDIAAVFTGPAAYDAGTESLVGEIKVMAPYRDLLEDLAPHIGLSIRGSATDVTEGEHDGKAVRVIEGLASIDSVDFVTRAGRGGQVIELLESADTNRRAIGRGVAEATVNDTREALGHALSDAYGGKERSAYVRDFDGTTVWFEVYDNGESGLYAQGFTEADGLVTLTGDREEVRAVTTYVTATRPDSTTSTTEESKEDPMAEVKIEEAELARLRDSDGRVTTLESERDTEKARADKAESALAEHERVAAARKIVESADVDFDDLQTDGLLASLPVKETGEFDTDAFTTRVTEAAAKVKARGGAGSITGFGGTGGGGQADITESDIDSAVGSAFGRPTLVKEA